MVCFASDGSEASASISNRGHVEIEDGRLSPNVFPFFPTSLCGVLVFGCALPPLRSRSRPLPPPSSHTQRVRTQLTHTHNLSTHNLSPHNLLTHNLLTHNMFTHNFTHTHNLSPHNLLTHSTWRHGHAFCVAGVALIVLGWLWWRAWAPLGAVVAAAVCVAGMALRDIDLRFAWQAWHFATSTFTLRGRRGTWRHGRAFCVAGVALIVLGWLWWRAWALLDAVVAVCMAGVALRDIDLHFAWPANVHSAWQAWHLSYWAGSGGALGPRWAPWSPPPFAWQAWHFATSTFTLRGRRGTYGTYNLSTFCLSSSCTYTLRTYTHAHTHIHTLCHARFYHTHIHTIFTHYCIHSFHAPSFDIHLLHTPILHHLLSLSCISHPIFTFLLLLIGPHWKKLTCGVIRSFNLLFEDVSISFQFSSSSNCNAIGSLNWFG